MSRIDRLLNRGIAFVKSGREEDARSLLRAAIADEPKNRLAWGWYVQSFSDEDERIQAFDGYLQVFPEDRNAVKLQATLLKKQNSRWKQLAVDAIHESEWHQQTTNDEVKKQQRTQNRSKFIFTFITLLVVGVFCIAGVVFVGKLNQLSTQMSQLDRENENLEFTHQSLEDQVETLIANYTALKTEYESIIEQYNTLVDDYNDLSAEYSYLLGEYNWLESIAVTPPYILTNGRNVTLAFNKLDGTILYWKFPFEALEADLKRGTLERSDIASLLWNWKLSLYNSNTDETYKVVDIRPFVKSSYFSNLMIDLYNESDSDEEFVKEVWNIVAQLTTYSTEIEETPRYPLETLLAGGGDCEDTAILLASMLDAAPVNWDIEFVYMDIYNPSSPNDLNHVAVYVKTADRNFLIETTSKDIMEPFYDGVYGWYYDIHD